MVGRAGGVLVHGAVLDSGDLLQPVVGEDPDAGRLLQQDGGVTQYQVADSVGLLAEDGDGGAVDRGWAPKEVAARAGHASVSFTLDRDGHLYPEADLSLRERLDAIWSASGGADRKFSRPQRERSGCAASARW